MATVLLPCNGSPNALLAVRHVVQAFRRGEVASVHLLNVQPSFSAHVARHVDWRVRADFHREQAVQALAAARGLLDDAGVPCTVHMEVGDKAACVIDGAHRWHCGRIVIGTARKSAVVRALMNSLTTQLMENCSVPMEVVSGPPAGVLQRVGIPAGVGAGMALLWVGAT